jgi:stage IV sporulation protein B
MKTKLKSLLCALLLCTLLLGAGVCPAQAKAAQASTLIPGGIPFGVKFTTEGVLVVGFSDISTADGQKNPAREAGLRLKDVLLSLDGVPIENAAALTEAIARSGGRALEVTYRRGSGEERRTALTPVADESGSFRTGLYVRDSGAGIGTVTYVDPQSLCFGGLGHGICDVDTGELMPLRRGNVVGVTVSGVRRGVAGTPGEIKGYFLADKQGSLLRNSPCGVFGVYSTLPSSILCEQAVPIADRAEVHDGQAHIYCTLSGNERRAYTVELSSIDRNAQGSKCFSVRVTDPALLEETGGIVQGMSGSPIIQDGKLVGAVTHVLIGDPSAGYGIFIENMLNAAE